MSLGLAKYGALCNIPREQRFQVSPEELQAGLGLGPNAVVWIYGLKKAELNGKQATVLGQNPESKRWTVRLHHDNSEVAVLDTKLVVERAARTGSFRIETLLIDVRDNEDFATYHIPGAINVPYSKMFMEQQKTLAKMREWKLSTTRVVTYATTDGMHGEGVSRDLSASNWLWELLGQPLNLLATLKGGLAGWVREGRPVEAGGMSESGPRKIFIQERPPQAFVSDGNAYEQAVERGAALPASAACPSLPAAVGAPQPAVQPPPPAPPVTAPPRPEEPPPEEVLVHIDRCLEVSTTVKLRPGMTVAMVKEEIAESDPTGATDPRDFCLKRCGSPAALGDLEKINMSLRELELHAL